MQSGVRGRISANAAVSRRILEPNPAGLRASGDPRKLLKSVFFVTINTNVSRNNAIITDELGVSRALSDAIHDIADSAADDMFQLSNSTKVPALYRGDNIADHVDNWKIMRYVNEWAPGKTRGKNSDGKQYLHSHVWVQAEHNTRLQVNARFVQQKIKDYFQHETSFGEMFSGNKKPYVNVKYVNYNTLETLNLYMRKNIVGSDDPQWVEASEDMVSRIDGGNVDIIEDYGPLVGGYGSMSDTD
jgi:hypothetical protein